MYFDSYIINLIDSHFNEYLRNFYYFLTQNAGKKWLFLVGKIGQGAVRAKRAPELTPADGSYLLLLPVLSGSLAAKARDET